MLLTRRFTVGVVVAAALAMAGGCGGDDEENGGGGGGTNTEEATPAPTEAAADGKQLFTNTCGGCHTLADANTNGQVGPNLDDLAPDKEQVLAALKAGPGPMPENLYQGAEAEAVAEYVSTAAGSGG